MLLLTVLIDDSLLVIREFAELIATFKLLSIFFEKLLSIEIVDKIYLYHLVLKIVKYYLFPIFVTDSIFVFSNKQ